MRANSGRTLDLFRDSPQIPGMEINRRFRERTPNARDSQQRYLSQPNTSGFLSFEENKFNEEFESESISEESDIGYQYVSDLTSGNISPSNYLRQPSIPFGEEMKVSTPPRRFISGKFKREIDNKKKNSIAENTEESAILS